MITLSNHSLCKKDILLQIDASVGNPRVSNPRHPTNIHSSQFIMCYFFNGRSLVNLQNAEGQREADYVPTLFDFPTKQFS